MILEREEGKERRREGGGGERETETDIEHAPIRDPACNPGMCPDWGLNLLPFGVRDDAQPTEPPTRDEFVSL